MTSETGSRRHPLWNGHVPSAALLVVGVPLSALTGVLPEVPALQLRLGIVCSGIVAVLVGLVVHRPPRPRAWLLLAAGMTSSALGDVVVLSVSSSEQLTANVPADAWLTTLAGVLILVAMFDATRTVRGAELGSTLDALVLALAGGVLLWHLAVVAQAVPGWAGGGTEVAGAMQVLFLVAVLGLLVRTANSIPRGERVAVTLLTIALLCALAAFLLGALREASAESISHYAGARAVFGAVANLIAGVAALHPTMLTLTVRRVPPPDQLDQRRTMLLGLALLAPPAVMLWTSIRGVATSPVTLAAAWAALVPAVLARLLLLARSRDAARDAALSSQQRTSSLVAHTSDALLLVDTDDDAEPGDRQWPVTFASPSTDTVLGVTSDDLEGRSVFEVVVDEDHDELRQLLEDVDSLPRARDVRAEHRDGSTRWVSVVVDALGSGGSERIVTLRDVTDRKREELRWAEQAQTDPLTGTLNRRGVEDRIELALSEIGESATLLGVILADLDGFKGINDRFGHATGDDVLREVARRLQSCVRDLDAVGRFGGDEFVVVCHGLESRDDLERVARRIPSTVGAPMQVAGLVDPVSVGVSVGVAIAEPELDSISRLLRRADVALYRAKSDGSGSVAWAGTSSVTEWGGRPAES